MGKIDFADIKDKAVSDLNLNLDTIDEISRLYLNVFEYDRDRVNIVTEDNNLLLDYFKTMVLHINNPPDGITKYPLTFHEFLEDVWPGDDDFINPDSKMTVKELAAFLNEQDRDHIPDYIQIRPTGKKQIKKPLSLAATLFMNGAMQPRNVPDKDSDFHYVNVPTYVTNIIHKNHNKWFFDIYIEPFSEATIQGSAITTYFQQKFLDIIHGRYSLRPKLAMAMQNCNYVALYEEKFYVERGGPEVATGIVIDPKGTYQIKMEKPIIKYYEQYPNTEVSDIIKIVKYIKILEEQLTTLYNEYLMYRDTHPYYHVEIAEVYKQMVPIYQLFIYYLENLSSWEITTTHLFVVRVIPLGTAGILRERYHRAYFDFYLYQMVFKAFGIPHTIAEDTSLQPSEKPLIDKDPKLPSTPELDKFYESIGFTKEFRENYLAKHMRYCRETPNMFTIWEYRYLQSYMKDFVNQNHKKNSKKPCHGMTSEDYVKLLDIYLKDNKPKTKLIRESIYNKLIACYHRSLLYEEHNLVIGNILEYIDYFKKKEQNEICTDLFIPLLYQYANDQKEQELNSKKAKSKTKKENKKDSQEPSEEEAKEPYYKLRPAKEIYDKALSIEDTAKRAAIFANWLLIRLFVCLYFFQFQTVFAIRYAAFVCGYIFVHQLDYLFPGATYIESITTDHGIDFVVGRYTKPSSSELLPNEGENNTGIRNPDIINVLYISKEYEIKKVFDVGYFKENYATKRIQPSNSVKINLIERTSPMINTVHFGKYAPGARPQPNPPIRIPDYRRRDTRLKSIRRPDRRRMKQ